MIVQPSSFHGKGRIFKSFGMLWCFTQVSFLNYRIPEISARCPLSLDGLILSIRSHDGALPGTAGATKYVGKDTSSTPYMSEP